jgi:hypothetical protein
MAPRVRSNLLYENDDIERVCTFEKQGTFAIYFFFWTKRNGAPGINAEIRRKNCTIEILLARSKRGTVWSINTHNQRTNVSSFYFGFFNTKFLKSPYNNTPQATEQNPFFMWMGIVFLMISQKKLDPIRPFYRSFVTNWIWKGRSLDALRVDVVLVPLCKFFVLQLLFFI